MIPDPPLLIMAPLVDDFDPAKLCWPAAARDRIVLNNAKFENLDIVEIILDGLVFLATRYTPQETRQHFLAHPFDRLFSARHGDSDSSIGLCLRDHLVGGRHVREVNQRLLLLGKWIGEALTATTVAWTPSLQLTDFDQFAGSVDQYLGGGPLPILFQTAILQNGERQYVTRGLDYFTGQEIRLTVPSTGNPSRVLHYLVRIIDQLAVNGTIDFAELPFGKSEGEKLSFSPSDGIGEILVESVEKDFGQAVQAAEGAA